jgi:hypothetical protein
MTEIPEHLLERARAARIRAYLAADKPESDNNQAKEQAMDDCIREAIKKLVASHRVEYEDLVYAIAKEKGCLSKIPFVRSADLTVLDGVIDHEED